MLRPESIHIEPSHVLKDPAANQFLGAIADITYLGEDLSLAVHVGEGLEFVVTAKTSFRTKALTAGQQVLLTAATSDVHILRA